MKGRSAIEDRMLRAVGDYLKTVGWKALVIGGVSIAKNGTREHDYEFRLKFLGGKMTPKTKPAAKKRPAPLTKIEHRNKARA